ncbi:helix-turn-helix transcriptional regulator [Microbispora sp. RL4-1S]|uniref:Helix-turn-helix transcriptional regulator n=1 Tax=Microbispora oryzae TaxID=2806554 RepID=A0A940WBW8_9ACTN|nr:TetR/AcrR family transcriptional regulator [Microbispora oryzae]MBP2702649.1 helix-turn-helix transcriptional regulator [Microbispora oryzae]
MSSTTGDGADPRAGARVVGVSAGRSRNGANGGGNGAAGVPLPGRELPVLDPGPRGGPVRERADAARNRARVLRAAEELFTARDPREVTMEDIARAAGVGRATLYRRYPDPASIATALLDEHERSLQEHILQGPPPLGPGAAPAERLTAFYTAMIDLLERHLHLVLGAETGATRFGTGAYGFWRAHVRALLAGAGVPDADVVADTALAPLAPEVYRFQRHTLGLPQARIMRSLAWTADRLTG